MSSEIISMSDFIGNYCSNMDLSEFTDCFYKGSVTSAASAFNVSRQTYHSWLSSDDYQVEVLYHEFENETLVHDYILKKIVKRVGAENKDKIETTGYVYAISSNGVTKIGASKSPKRRVKEVASRLGFVDYDIYISNISSNYLREESKCHKDLKDKARENTIYQREVFSCSIDEAAKVINDNVMGVSSGAKSTWSGFFNKVKVGSYD